MFKKWIAPLGSRLGPEISGGGSVHHDITTVTSGIPPSLVLASPSPTAVAMNLLFLHGYTQSGPLFSAKTKAVQKALTKSFGPNTTLHFPTGPIKLSPADIPGDAIPDDAGDLEAYGWWRRATPTSAYIGLPETFFFLSAYLDTHGPFDGVVGFSQGAALAAILAAVLEKGRKRPEEFTTSHPPLKFAVCYSGFRAPEVYKEWYEPMIETKLLHIIGSLDTVVDEERSLALAKACVDGDKRTVYHPGGHYLPAQKPLVNALIGFILQCVKEENKEENLDLDAMLEGNCRQLCFSSNGGP